MKNTKKTRDPQARFPEENPNPVLRVTWEGKVLYANKASGTLLREWGARTGKALPKEWTERISTVINGNRIKRTEIFHKNSIFSLSIVPIKGEKCANIYGMDITGLKRAEISARKSEERLQVVACATNDAIWDWDLEKGTVWWNQAVSGLFGYSRGEIRKKHAWKLGKIHLKDRERIKNSLDKAIKGKGAIWTGEYRFKCSNGTYKHILDRGFIMRDIADMPVRMIGSMMDITEQKKAEALQKRDKEEIEKIIRLRTRELIFAQKELARKRRLSDIGALAATVAHELRNPLGVIKVATYNIKRKNKDGELDKHLFNLERHIDESELFIKNLLSYTRIRVPDYQKTDIRQLIKECAETCGKTHPDTKVKLILVPLSDDNRMIEMDIGHFREILTNLLNNAYQAIGPERGSIEIRTSVVSKKGKKHYRISVSDNGCGIDREDIKKVFQPFFSLKPQGTGLGLAICAELIAMHNGVISIKSEKKQGTTVTFTLPAERPASKYPNMPKSRKKSTKSGPRP
ncbi:MAG: ATP-binding protein [Candidatus Omnitrophica bacterium]|nr:ATP-binding protein [Candidatus Omnitrophota bacterium]MDD5488712.1 ATP-binding protein [Candidatus Omnitrophota bacterium]